MQIALTKKLADAMEVSPMNIQVDENPLYSWTVNWTKVWSNRRTEDMLVMVNNATRFTVAIYQVKKKDLKNAEKIIKASISNTLLAMNINPEIVDEYMRLGGEINFTRNSNRQASVWVTKAYNMCAVYVENHYNGIDKMFSDTIGAPINYRIVNYSGKYEDAYFPYRAMRDALTKLTGKQAYKYRAFELSVTLDLEVYKAVRRIIVPAEIEFAQLHKVLQDVFDWRNYHLYEFAVFDGKNREPIARIVPFDDDLEDESDIIMEGHKLSEFFPKNKYMLYAYDMGDYWEHEIKLVRVIEDYDKESPFLLEAIGQTPPEDVGGVGGFIEFREIMLNPDHPEYTEAKEWVGYWDVELEDRQKKPRLILD